MPAFFCIYAGKLAKRVSFGLLNKKGGRFTDVSDKSEGGGRKEPWILSLSVLMRRCMQRRRV